MSIVQDTHSRLAVKNEAAPCPFHPASPATKKSGHNIVAGAPPLGRTRRGVWRVRGFEEARAILRSNDTKQAGFRAELVTAGNNLGNQPILYQEGKVHNELRARTARFFTPKTVSTKYRRLMETLSDRMIAELKRNHGADLSHLSMTLAVQVAGQVVGLTSSVVPGMDRRLEAFFDETGASYRSSLVSRVMEIANLRRLLMFYWLDVRPAIRARRVKAQEDVISYLIAQGYNDREILTECVTYAAAGMATTREFISMAAWHFLEHPDLRAHYLAAPEEERTQLLHEVLRLEPVVGHLYRRTTAYISLKTGGREVVIPAGALIDISIEAANIDEKVTGAEPLELCPGREIHAERAGAMLMSFGDGAHRCPGAYVAIQETDIFLQRLLALKNLRMKRPPTLTWNELTAGYELRKFQLVLG